MPDAETLCNNCKYWWLNIVSKLFKLKLYYLQLKAQFFHFCSCINFSLHSLEVLAFWLKLFNLDRSKHASWLKYCFLLFLKYKFSPIILFLQLISPIDFCRWSNSWICELFITSLVWNMFSFDLVFDFTKI